MLTGLVTALILLTGCSGSTDAAPASSVSTPTAVVTSTSDAVVTQTDVVTDTAEVTDTARVTRTADVTRTSTSAPASSGGGSATTGGGGGATTSSAPVACPDSATLGPVTPDYNPKYPITVVNCDEQWAVGTYDADGKNQTTGIWRNTGGAWAHQDRAAICATADNLPQELYNQACQGN